MKRLISRLTSVLLLLALLIPSLAACDRSGDPVSTTGEPEQGIFQLPWPMAQRLTLPLRITGSNWMDHDFTVTLNVDDTVWTGDLSVYNEDIARFCLLLQLINSGSEFSDEDGTIPLPEALSLRNLRKITMEHEAYERDENDLTNALFAMKEFRSGGDFTQLFIVSLDPYVDDTGWSSNLDVGADTEAYRELFGVSEDWADKEDHKGFSVSATRLVRRFEEYYHEFLVPDTHSVILVTGQSRGGAIAGLVGKDLLDRGLSAVVYGFNTPCNTCAPETETAKYPTIFNILNEQDIVSRLPLADWGFRRYGRDLTYSLSGSEKTYAEMFGREYYGLDEETIEQLEDLFRTLSDTRANIYEFTTREEILDWQRICFDDIRWRESRQEELNTLFDEASLQAHCIRTSVWDTEEGFWLEYQTRPVLFVTLAERLIPLLYAEEYNLSMVLMELVPYLSVIDGYSDMITTVFSFMEDDSLVTERILLSHVIYTDFLGITLIR